MSSLSTAFALLPARGWEGEHAVGFAMQEHHVTRRPLVVLGDLRGDILVTGASLDPQVLARGVDVPVAGRRVRIAGRFHA
jgi:hypothetical protein